MKKSELKSLIKQTILEMYASTGFSSGIAGRTYGKIGTDENPGNKVQTALLILGIDPSLIYGVRHQVKGISYNPNSKVSGGFWSRGDEYLWNILEMAKNNYVSLIKKYHPDVSGPEGEQKARELNVAWNLVKTTFAKKGYDIV